MHNLRGRILSDLDRVLPDLRGVVMHNLHGAVMHNLRGAVMHNLHGRILSDFGDRVLDFRGHLRLDLRGRILSDLGDRVLDFRGHLRLDLGAVMHNLLGGILSDFGNHVLYFRGHLRLELTEIMPKPSGPKSRHVPLVGDNVEFHIQSRSGKEVACNIVSLPEGTVVFEDVGTEYFKGQVIKPIAKSAKFNAGNTGRTGTNSGGVEALIGRIKFRGLGRSEEEIQFTEKDQIGEFTLCRGDWIRFVVAVDRRDKARHAAKIEKITSELGRKY